MGIPRLNLDEFLEDNRECKVLKRCKDTMIIQLSNGELLKILDDKLLEKLSDTGFSLEERLNEVLNLSKNINLFAIIAEQIVK